MNCLEKLYKLKLFTEELDIYLNIPQHGTPIEEVKKLKRRYAFFPEDYENFLRSYDGFYISWCTFIGSDSWELATRSEANSLWKNVIETKYIPIALNAQGDLFAINSSGQIVMFDAHTETEELVASSFSEFIDDCILGKRYGEFAITDNSPFYDFLKSQRWV